MSDCHLKQKTRIAGSVYELDIYNSRYSSPCFAPHLPCKPVHVPDHGLSRLGLFSIMASEQQSPATITALVTGAAGGLGWTIAEGFLAAGHNVAICDVNKERLGAVSSDWSASYPGRFLAENVDITDEVAVEGLVTATTSKFGRLDFVVTKFAVNAINLDLSKFSERVPRRIKTATTGSGSTPIVSISQARQSSPKPSIPCTPGIAMRKSATSISQTWLHVRSALANSVTSAMAGGTDAGGRYRNSSRPDRLSSLR